ncbi:hypothetical protein Tco_0056557, partial [Tanacetum coccineum]
KGENCSNRCSSKVLTALTGDDGASLIKDGLAVVVHIQRNSIDGTPKENSVDGTSRSSGSISSAVVGAYSYSVSLTVLFSTLLPFSITS